MWRSCRLSIDDASEGENLDRYGLYICVPGPTALALLIVADLSCGGIGLTDIGTIAVVGGAIGETLVRIGTMSGREFEIDGWREGMFFGALIALLIWAFGESGV